uniref:(California timema) hypothetical protein n=1 Tax=Timema californicum TaxID=61474 RepID=A0A7R9JG22_TIMCA|nr:unnamed protein product [Timema californicum]
MTQRGTGLVLQIGVKKAPDDNLKKPLSSRSTKRMFADEAAEYDKLHFDDILQAHKIIRPDVHVSPLVTRYTPDTQPYGTFAALLETDSVLGLWAVLVAALSDNTTFK